MEDNSRAKLMNRLQIADFVLDETGLYLDTHPNDKIALDYYTRWQDVRNQAMKEFTEQYGPIIAEDYNGSPTWTWVDNPWPWDNEREV